MAASALLVALVIAFNKQETDALPSRRRATRGVPGRRALRQLQSSAYAEDVKFHTTLVGKCNESMDPDENPYADSWGIEMASATTFRLWIDDGRLQRYMTYHPATCFAEDIAEHSDVGSVVVIVDFCHVLIPDFDQCFKHGYIKYPVAVDSTALKIELRPWPVDAIGEELDDDTKPQLGAKFTIPVYQYGMLFQQARGKLAAAEENLVELEVCGNPRACVPFSGSCIPTVALIGEKHTRDGDYNAWPARGFGWEPAEFEAEEWQQPNAVGTYGPYPPCPEDADGRALTCEGDEVLTLHVKSVTLDRAEFNAAGDAASFSMSFELAWGDRYAVHPCTINLFSVRTGGKQYRIPATGFWTPTLDIANPTKATALKEAEKTLGVSYGVGNPVLGPALVETEDNVTQVPWPKQLLLSRVYNFDYFPTALVDWDKFPFDSQKMTIMLSEQSVPVGMMDLRLWDGNVVYDFVNVGEMWVLDSVTTKQVTKRGRPWVQITVEVSRSSSGKVYGVIIPIVSIAFLDVAFHLLTPYDDVKEVFITAAIIASVGVQMIDPGFLGLPSGLARMPFLQCFCLMVLVGGLKTMLMIVLRSFWKGRIEKLEAQCGESQSEEDQGASRKVMRLRSQLRIYDLVTKASVPIWYIASWLVVVVIYLS
jgi:hypothetical protein